MSAKLRTRFSRKENVKKRTSLEKQKGWRYIRGIVYFEIIVFIYLSSTKPCLGFLKIYFAREIKGFYRIFWGNEADFTDASPKMVYVSQKSRLKLKFHNTRFCRWKSNDCNDIIFLSLENPCALLLAKEKTWKRIFNPNSEVSQNHTERQFISSKTTINWLFHDICYLVIVFYLINGIFQQTVVRVYIISWIPNSWSSN